MYDSPGFGRGADGGGAHVAAARSGAEAEDEVGRAELGTTKKLWQVVSEGVARLSPHP